MFKDYKKIILLVLVSLVVFNLVLVEEVGAQRTLTDIIGEQFRDLSQIGLPGEPERPADVVVGLIRMILGFLALVFLILILWAGFRWMTSAGNTEIIDKAKKIIASALIGLIIIFLSYAITAFIFKVVLSAK